MDVKLLIIPGLGDSGEEHWQTYWLRKFDHSIKLVQDNWNGPSLNRWLERLNETIVNLDCPLILVAHSLANALVAHWACNFKNRNVKGALLVAPADVNSPDHTPDLVRGFSPMPESKLPFPSTVVASSDDTYVDLQRARYYAVKWGSEFVNIGPKGHINSESHLLYWEEGQLILNRLS